MLTDGIAAVVALVNGFFASIVSGVTDLAGIFYVESHLTFWGTMAFVGLGLSLVFFIINWVRSLIKVGR